MRVKYSRWFFIGIILLFILPIKVKAQNSVDIAALDSLSGEPLPGVLIKGPSLSLSAVTDLSGKARLSGIQDGKISFSLEYSGYVRKVLYLNFPMPNSGKVIVRLKAEGEVMEVVTVSSSRTGSRIEDLPMKVEVLGEEDMTEENGIKPGNINSILGDISIVHLQQTSQVSGNTAVRMQGLDGKYTQLLRDGLPLYEGFSGSFGVLQVPPLDLRQVELIKGSVSTLYGGGAISGLINLISKEPTDSAQTTFTLNQTSLKETNLNAYYAKRSKYLGVTLFAGSNLQQAVDVDKDGFSDLPEIKSMLFHPRLFIYLHPKIKLNLGISSLFESRTGGDMSAITVRPDSNHAYYERNKTDRQTFDLHFAWKAKEKSTLSLQGTTSLFNRDADQSGSLLQGKQISSYYEASYNLKAGKHNLVAGSNYTCELFHKKYADSVHFSDYFYQTKGFFLQDGWQLHSKFLAEGGLRFDMHNIYGSFFLPRLSILYKPERDLSIRLNVGTGYKTPNIFTAQTLSESFSRLAPLTSDLKAERSTGLNCDINYAFLLFHKMLFQINQAFYYSQIENPIVLLSNPSSLIRQVNSNYSALSKGSDTYIRMKLEEVELYIGYNHTIANYTSGKMDYVLYSPQDKFSTTLAYELESHWRLGLESSWIGNQYVNIDTKGRNFWLWALMVGYKFNKVNLVLNGENLLDIRQSRFENMVSGPISRPVFRGIYAPIDGRVINLSIRISI